SRIEGGALRPEKDWYSIDEVIQEVIQRLEHTLADHPLTMRIEDDLPLIPLDFAEIDQVLTNLLENVRKHTPAGTAISVEAQRAGNDVRVQIADNGPGVPAEHLAHIFDKLYRVGMSVAAGAHTGHAKDIGLGLAITKGLVET